MSVGATRRDVLRGMAASALAVAWGACRHPIPRRSLPPGALVPQGEGLLALPRGFSAVVLQRAGDPMDDGARVPIQPDGMTCHALGDRWVLLRNHEIGSDGWLRRRGLDPDRLRAGRPELGPGEPMGGVTRVVIDPRRLFSELEGSPPETSRAVVASHLLLSGTVRNCAGGHTPTGWVSCEESDRDGAGWAWRCERTDEGLVDRRARRLDGWGRFRREAIDLDPVTGVATMTEDHRLGCVYRHVPDRPEDPFGPGRLQALSLPGIAHANRGHDDRIADLDRGVPLEVGQRFQARWVDVPDPSAASSRCRDQGAEAGATRFCRTEGITRDRQGRLVFAATTEGPAGAGRLWRLDPETDEVTLVYEVHDRAVLSMPDNLVRTPWGDVLACEDNYGADDGARYNHLRLFTAAGEIVDFARNLDNRPGTDEAPGAEFAGACFSPDGRVLFVNLMWPLGHTVAIAGPWPKG